MTTAAIVSERLAQQGVLVIEGSIPEDMTIAEWRRARTRTGRRPRWRGTWTRTDAATTSAALL
jgi:hypothetical protein